jgi:SpoVK/Ycf46/Vps4 family AAA+-type ATPase
MWSFFISQTETEAFTPGTVHKAYSAIGGLDKQIQEIRDLLEIPLTRPELFTYFGAHYLQNPFYLVVAKQCALFVASSSIPLAL